MAESVEIKCSHVSGVLSRYRRVTFGLCKKEFKMMFLFRKIRNTILRHAELVSESRDVDTKKRVQGDKIFKKAFAFTLAETLIVMGIIGVVAALTIPNLNSSTADKEKVAKVKKIYSNLNDALGRAQSVYGPVNEWFVNDTTETAQVTRFGERVTEFMKVSKNCGVATNQGRFSIKNVRFIDGQDAGGSVDTRPSLYKIILADGTAVAMKNTSFQVDIDGPNKGQNQLGTDIFLFRNGDDGIVTPFAPDNFSEYLDGSKNSIMKNGNKASAWVINYDNMDYLKLDSSGKCPNGKTPTEQNPRCK